jgi:hypothetical protein
LIVGNADNVQGTLSIRIEVTLEPGQLPLFGTQMTDATGITSEWEIHGTETPDVKGDGRIGRIAFTFWGQASSGPAFRGFTGADVGGELSWTCVGNPGP